jgi:outer membrane receptor protein involved in Fe transport
MKMIRIHMKLLLIVVFSCFIYSLASAQSGVISGLVVDGETGEELIGVTVRIDGSMTGGISDISGNYRFDVEPGEYTVVASYVSYATQRIERVKVENGEVTKLDFTMLTQRMELEEIVVSATAINNNEASILKMQKKSLAVQDGISSSEMRKIGVSNSAESMKQVTGASVEDGKYVVMRGLGDRYSLTQLNGAILPSTDPYRNSPSMDLIPVAMVDNIVTTKSFTPDQPGSFSGGNVNITTKSLPDQFYLNLGVKFEYNTRASLKDEFYTDPVVGSKDWIGIDDGSRNIPEYLTDTDNLNTLSNQGIYIKVRQKNEQYDSDRELFDKAAKDLNVNSYVPTYSKSFMNYGLNFAFGDRVPISGKSFGYNVGFRYNRGYTRFPDRILRILEYSSDPAAEELNTNLDLNGNQSFENINFGGILSLAYQFNNSNEIQLNTMYNHDTEKQASSLSGIFPGAISGPHTFTSRNINFLERSMGNAQLSGRHVIGTLNGLKIEWLGGYTLSKQYEPDVRIFANDETPTGFTITKAEYDLPFHFWRDLEDTQINGKIDITIPLGKNSSNLIKAGGLYSSKQREFGETRFQLESQGTNQDLDEYTSFNQAGQIDPVTFEPFFAQENSGILPNLENPSTDPNNPFRYIMGNYYLNQTRPTNIYSGHENITAAYLMGVWEFLPNWKLILGARLEHTDYEVVSEDPNTETGKIDQMDVLPSANLIWALTEKSNLRFSVSQTLARPNMREMAPFVNVDFIGGFFFIGNPFIKMSKIMNFDIRYELFNRPGELFAVSAFYKSFADPIVKILVPVASGGQIRMGNSEDGQLGGFEIDYRKNITEKFKFGVNFTYTLSRVMLEEEEYATGSQVNPDLKPYRPFQAQSPFILNLLFSYSNFAKSIESTLSMNMFGRRLYANGFGGAPDIYEINGTNSKAIPDPDLNFTISKGFGDHIEVYFRWLNILDFQTVRNQEFNNQYFVTESYRRGTRFALGFNYRL